MQNKNEERYEIEKQVWKSTLEKIKPKRETPPPKPKLKTWRKIKKQFKYTPTTWKYITWIRKYWEGGNKGKPIDLKKMMSDCGKDYGKTKENREAMYFLAIGRKMFAIVLKVLLDSEKYKELKNNGVRDEKIYEWLVESAISRGVYPLWYNTRIKAYCLFDMQSYIEFTKRGGYRIKKYIERCSKELMLLSKKLPALYTAYEQEKPKLTSNSTFIGLPILCEKCHKDFATQDELVEHYNKEHK